MRTLKWSMSDAVFVPEIDDEHKEIFQVLCDFEQALANGAPEPEIHPAMERLVTCIVEHFAHEERLMRASRYSSLRWHKQRHDAARLRVEQFVARIEQGDGKAAPELVAYLKSWLRHHTRLPDRMLGAYLRNHERSIYKLTFRAGTRPMDACSWVDTQGNKFDPQQ
jgi:hemerythrin